MATFYKAINNGTIGIMPEETYQAFLAWLKLVPEAREAQPYPTPIFTFVSEEHYATDRYRHIVTGDHGLMDFLLEGHTVVDGSFYVPFSNHTELQGGDAAERELRYRTTLADAVKAFGLTSTSLIRS